MIADFLSRLANVKTIKCGQHLACCPAHNDQHPSLLVTEADDRVLIHCRAGCPTSDVLGVMGLDFSDLFLDLGKTKGTTPRIGPRQPERVPSWYWDWRSQCGELERAIQEKREHAEAMIAVTQGLDVNALTTTEFDEAMDWVGRAYDWLDRCERLDDTLYLVQQDLRAEEQAERVQARKGRHEKANNG